MAQTVTATINYLDPQGEPAYAYVGPAPDGVPERSGEIDAQAMPIANAREALPEAHIDRECFMKVTQHTAVSDFYDEEQLKTVYFPELSEFVAAELQADKVVIFDHNLRNVELFKQGCKHGAVEPVMQAHNDYTLASAPARVRELLPPEEAEQRLQNRFMEINIWRPIRGPVQCDPLAVCDGSSMRADDFIPTRIHFPNGRSGWVASIRHNPSHRWYYYPQLAQHETLFLKCFDSLTDGRPQMGAHTAFTDPTAAPDAPPRESIETRMFVFF